MGIFEVGSQSVDALEVLEDNFLIWDFDPEPVFNKSDQLKDRQRIQDTGAEQIFVLIQFCILVSHYFILDKLDQCGLPVHSLANSLKNKKMIPSVD